MVKLKINTRLLPMKAHYFLYNGGTAPVVPFMPTYAKQLGFSTVIVGTLYTVLPIAGMIAKPLFGAFADRWKWHKQFFLIFLALTGLLFFGINFIPETSLEDGPGSSLDCGDETIIKSCGHKPDDCAIHKLLVATGNDTVVCYLSCPEVSAEEWDQELCESWNLEQYCVSPANSTTSSHNQTRHLEFHASIPIYHTLMFSDCLYFRIKTAYFKAENVTPYCSKSISTKECKVTCDEPVVNELLNKRPVVDDSELLASPNLWFFSFGMLTSWISMAVVVSIGDAICFEMLGDRPSNYGQQRVWGSIGWGIFSMLAGYFVDLASKGQSYKNYSIVFYMTLVILSFDFLVSTRLQVKHTKMSASIVRDVGRLLSEIRINIFLIWCITVGMCTGLLWSFLFWHLEELAVAQGCEAFEWIKTLQGLVMGVQCFGGELPFFFISGWVLKKIGHIHAMSMVLFGFGVRFFLYYWLVNPWWVLPIELLNGITFGIFYATMASYASIVAPPGTEATVQGLVGSVFEGVGVSLGSLFGGILYASVGGALTFFWFAMMSLIVFLLHVVVQYILSKRRGVADVAFQQETKEFPMTARYATPTDAIYMLDEPQDNN